MLDPSHEDSTPMTYPDPRYLGRNGLREAAWSTPDPDRRA
jgi:hypothetical protein